MNMLFGGIVISKHFSIVCPNTYEMIKFWNAEVFAKIYSVKSLYLSCSLSVILEVMNHFLTNMSITKKGVGK